MVRHAAVDWEDSVLMLPGELDEPALERLCLYDVPPVDAFDATPQFPDHEHAQVDLAVVDPGEPRANVHVGSHAFPQFRNHVGIEQQTHKHIPRNLRVFGFGGPTLSGRTLAQGPHDGFVEIANNELWHANLFRLLSLIAIADARHRTCSHLAMQGAPSRAIQELEGHRDLGTAERYMHRSQAALEATIPLLERTEPLGCGASGNVGSIRVRGRAGNISRVSAAHPL